MSEMVRSTGAQVAGATAAYVVLIIIGAIAAYFITRAASKHTGTTKSVFLGDMTMVGGLVGVALSAALYLAYFRPKVLAKSI